MTDFYYTLFECWRREKQKPDLQALPEEFNKNVANYVSQLREQAQSTEKDSIKGKILVREMEHTEKMLQELNQLRVRKLIISEVNDTHLEPLNLMIEEKWLHIELRRLVTSHIHTLRQIQSGRETKTEAVQPPSITTITPPSPQHILPERTRSLKVIRFLQPLPAIMGVDMKTYGPFKAEDVASLPAQNAENLIRKGIAKEVETKQ